jgi:hypothetical protein
MITWTWRICPDVPDRESEAAQTEFLGILETMNTEKWQDIDRVATATDRLQVLEESTPKPR